LVAFVQQVVIDLAGAHQHPADLGVGDQVAGFGQHPIEPGSGLELVEVGDAQLVPQQRFGRHDDQRLAVIAAQLAA